MTVAEGKDCGFRVRAEAWWAWQNGPCRPCRLYEIFCIHSRHPSYKSYHRGILKENMNYKISSYAASLAASAYAIRCKKIKT